MNDAGLLAQAVAALKTLGLNYAFVLDAGERRGLPARPARHLRALRVLTVPCSLAAGVAIAAALTSPRRWVALPARAFVEPHAQHADAGAALLRLPRAQHADHAAAAAAWAAIPLTPFVWVVIVVALHKGVFHAEALRAGIEAVPRVTLEAARSLGFSQRQLLWRVELPLALRFALPSLVNNWSTWSR